MQKIDIERVIKNSTLSKKDIAIELFPSVNYPIMALKRVIKKEVTLNADQISKLSSITGLSISQLFSGEKWKAKKENSTHIFTCGNYRAELDTKTWITKIYHKDSLFHDSIIHDRTILLGQYLENLNSIIIKS